MNQDIDFSDPWAEKSPQIAFVSFAIGTVLLGSLTLYPKEDLIIQAGIVYLLMALCVNLVYLGVLLIKLITYRRCFYYYLKRIGWLLLNLPVAFLYAIIALGILI